MIAAFKRPISASCSAMPLSKLVRQVSWSQLAMICASMYDGRGLGASSSIHFTKPSCMVASGSEGHSAGKVRGWTQLLKR